MTSALFRRIADELRERIALGDVGPGGALESEAEIGRRTGASRMTIRKALDVLRNEGLAEPRQGSGWFVTANSFRQRLALGTFLHAESAVSASGRRLVREIQSFAFVPAPAYVASLLGVPDASDVLRCRSIRSSEGDALDRTTEWVAGAGAAAMSRSAAEDPGIWRSLQRAGSEIATVRQSITAGVAGESDAQLLGVATGAPMLLVRRVALDRSGSALALSDHRYLAARFSLEVSFHGWSGSVDAPPGLREQP